MRISLRVGVIYNYNTKSDASPQPENICCRVAWGKRSAPQPGVQMGPKLLFVIGILAAHGALGAAWLQEEAPRSRSPMASCIKAPAPLPYFEARREMLAMQVLPLMPPAGAEEWQP